MWWRDTDRRGWRDADHVALDFETTDADPRRAEPLAVGWVAVRSGRVRIGEAGYHLIAHDGEVPVASMRIHGLLPHALRDGIDRTALVDDLRRVVTGRVVVAHGAWIERALLDRLGVDHAGVVDTLAVVRRLDARAGRMPGATALAAVARRFGVPAPRSHHAFGDALATALLFVTLAGRLEHDRGACTVDDLLRLGGR